MERQRYGISFQWLNASFYYAKECDIAILILLKEGASARKTQTPAAQPVPRPGKNMKLSVFFFYNHNSENFWYV